jgi:hypothetical protein
MVSTVAVNIFDTFVDCEIGYEFTKGEDGNITSIHDHNFEDIREHYDIVSVTHNGDDVTCLLLFPSFETEIMDRLEDLWREV